MQKLWLHGWAPRQSTVHEMLCSGRETHAQVVLQSGRSTYPKRRRKGNEKVWEHIWKTRLKTQRSLKRVGTRTRAAPMGYC